MGRVGDTADDHTARLRYAMPLAVPSRARVAPNRFLREIPQWYPRASDEGARSRWTLADDHELGGLAHVAHMHPPAPPWDPKAQPTLTVAFLDSGQGDTNLVVFPNGQLMLIDCGSIKSSQVVLPEIIQALERYVPAHGVIDWLVLTHADQDHYNLLRGLAKYGFSFANVWYGCDAKLYRNKNDGNYAASLVGKATAWSPGPSYFGVHAPLMTVQGVEVWMLAANSTGNTAAAAAGPKNTNSIVLMLRFGVYRVFMMGDATAATEASILGALLKPGVPANLITNVHGRTTLKMGHHGSDTSSSQAWIQAVAPNALTISADTREFAHTGMPKASHLNEVVGWSGNIVPAVAHTIVVWDDLIVNEKFIAQQSSIAVCSTLNRLVYNAFGTAYDASGCSWYLFVANSGAVSLETT